VPISNTGNMKITTDAVLYKKAAYRRINGSEYSGNTLSVNDVVSYEEEFLTK